MRATPSSRCAKSWQTPAPIESESSIEELHVRRALHVAKALVNQVRRGLRKTGHGAAADLFGRLDQVG